MTRTAVVVGAGVFGLSTAKELGARGWRVTVIDAHGPGVWGPSTAETRILRYSHGADSWYTATAWRARALWEDLEKETGRQLFMPTGVLTLTTSHPRDDAWATATQECLHRLGIPFEPMGHGTLSRRFPAFAATNGEGAVYEPEAGVLRAREAVLALADSAGERGVRFQRGVAVPAGDHLLVDGEPVTADLVVWAAGTALPGHFPWVASVRPVRLDSWYFEPRSPWLGTDGQPAWLDRAHGCYGIPDVGSQRIKIIVDVEVDLNRGVGLPPDDLARSARRYVAARLPALAESPLLQREPCWYAATTDEHFLLAPHPAHDHVWLVGGDSGHGFKHGPAWGSYVVDVIEGRIAAEPHCGLR